MVIAKLRAPMQPGEGWGYGVWGTGTIVVVIPEIYAAADGRSPWPTISATVGRLEYNSDWVAPEVELAGVVEADRAVGGGEERFEGTEVGGGLGLEGSQALGKRGVHTG